MYLIVSYPIVLSFIVSYLFLRAHSLESGTEAELLGWKKRAEAAEKALVNKDREILSAKDRVSTSVYHTMDCIPECFTVVLHTLVCEVYHTMDCMCGLPCGSACTGVHTFNILSHWELSLLSSGKTVSRRTAHSEIRV